MTVEETDKHLGAAVAALRGDVSQKAIADAMRARGHKWHPATVWAIERGERPLKLSEALSLSEEFGVRLDELVDADPKRRQMQNVLDEALDTLGIVRRAIDVYSDRRNYALELYARSAAEGLADDDLDEARDVLAARPAPPFPLDEQARLLLDAAQTRLGRSVLDWPS